MKLMDWLLAAGNVFQRSARRLVKSARFRLGVLLVLAWNAAVNVYPAGHYRSGIISDFAQFWWTLGKRIDPSEGHLTAQISGIILFLAPYLCWWAIQPVAAAWRRRDT